MESSKDVLVEGQGIGSGYTDPLVNDRCREVRLCFWMARPQCLVSVTDLQSSVE